MAVLEAPATLTDDQLRERLVAWLRENLPPLWVEAIEENDPEKLRKARELVDYDDWWFSLRPSNTEPLLRLNVEAREPAVGEGERDKILSMIRG